MSEHTHLQVCMYFQDMISLPYKFVLRVIKFGSKLRVMVTVYSYCQYYVLFNKIRYSISDFLRFVQAHSCRPRN